MVEGAIKRLELLRTRPELRERLWTIVRALQAGLKADGLNIGRTNSPVTPVYLSGSVAEGTQVAMDLRENYNLFCSIVVYPVIPKGQLLLRLIPTAMHTLEDVEYTVKAFKNVETDKKLVVAGGSSDTDSFTKELRELAADDKRIILSKRGTTNIICLQILAVIYMIHKKYKQQITIRFLYQSRKPVNSQAFQRKP